MSKSKQLLLAKNTQMSKSKQLLSKSKQLLLAENTQMSKSKQLLSKSKLRNTYRNTVFANEWEALANVYHSKEVENDALYRGLLFNRCILEYRYLNPEGESQVWYDIHPLIKGIKEFQDTFNRLYPAENATPKNATP